MADQHESIRSISALPTVRHVSFARGLAWAIPWGVCGFCVPYVGLGGLLLLRVALRYEAWFVASPAFYGLPSKGIIAAVACATLFAWAAFANYASRRGVGFVRSLLVLSLLFLAAGFVAALASAIFDLDRGRTYTSDGPYEWVARLVFGVLFFTSAIWFTCWQIRKPSG